MDFRNVTTASAAALDESLTAHCALRIAHSALSKAYRRAAVDASRIRAVASGSRKPLPGTFMFVKSIVHSTAYLFIANAEVHNYIATPSVFAEALLPGAVCVCANF